MLYGTGVPLQRNVAVRMLSRPIPHLVRGYAPIFGGTRQSGVEEEEEVARRCVDRSVAWRSRRIEA